MPRTLNDSPSWTNALTGPVAGDPRIAASVSVPMEALACRTQALRQREHMLPLIVEAAATSVTLEGRAFAGREHPVHILAVREVPGAGPLDVYLHTQGASLAQGDALVVERIGAHASNSAREVRVHLVNTLGSDTWVERITADIAGVMFTVASSASPSGHAVLSWAATRRWVANPSVLSNLTVVQAEANSLVAIAAETETLTVSESATIATATVATIAIAAGTADLTSLGADFVTARHGLTVGGDGITATTIRARDLAVSGAVRLGQRIESFVTVHADDERRRAQIEAPAGEVGSDWVPGFYSSNYPDWVQSGSDPFWQARQTNDPIPAEIRQYNPTLPATVDDQIPQADRTISQLQWCDYRRGVGRVARLDQLTGSRMLYPMAFTVEPERASTWVVHPGSELDIVALVTWVAECGSMARIVFCPDPAVAPLTGAAAAAAQSPTLEIVSRDPSGPRRLDGSIPQSGHTPYTWIGRHIAALTLNQWVDLLCVDGNATFIVVARGAL